MLVISCHGGMTRDDKEKQLHVSLEVVENEMLIL